MSFETALYTALTTHAGLNALIGGRCEPGALPPETQLPAIAYLLVSDVPEQTGAGAVAGHRYHVQLSCLAATYQGVIALTAQANLALIAFAAGAYELTLQSEQDVGAPDPETGIYHRAIDAVLSTTFGTGGALATVVIYQTDTPAAAVIVYEPDDETPRLQRRMEPMFDSNGDLVVYQETDGMETLAVRGRLLDLSSASLLATWAYGDELLSYTDRAGTTTIGWRAHTEPPPIVRHAMDGGTDWTLDMTLWRIS